MPEQRNLVMCLRWQHLERPGMIFLRDYRDSTVDVMRYADHHLRWMGHDRVTILIPQRMIGHQQHQVYHYYYACIYLYDGWFQDDFVNLENNYVTHVNFFLQTISMKDVIRFNEQRIIW